MAVMGLKSGEMETKLGLKKEKSGEKKEEHTSIFFTVFYYFVFFFRKKKLGKKKEFSFFHKKYRKMRNFLLSCFPVFLVFFGKTREK